MNGINSKLFLASQSGSILVYCLGILILIVLSLGYSFNASRVSAEKTRLQNTADAAAYSVAAVEARDLNFKSYTNRAMVANQVALAQSVSLISWARFVTRFADNISMVTSAFPPLRVFTALSKGIAAVMKGLEVAVNLAINAINFIEQALSIAQMSHHVGTLAMAKDIFNEVVKRNDPDVDRSLSLSSAPFMGAYLKDHATFTKRYSPDKVTRANKARKWTGVYDEHQKRMDEFRLVTLESRDLFSKNRTYDWVGSFTVIPKYLKLRIRKTGGSELTGSAKSPDKLGSYYTWSAMDTMSVHKRRYKCSFSSGCKWRSWKEVLPIGWGAAATRGGRPFFFERGLGGKHRYASSYRINKYSATAAGAEYQSLGASGTFSGLRAFYDIQQDGLLSEAPGIAVMLTKPHSGSAVKTLKHTEFGDGSDDLDLESGGGFLNDRLAALSQAVPYFSRPNDVSAFRRWDKLREYGNLYNPFWQPRLSELKHRKAMLGWAATLL